MEITLTKLEAARRQLRTAIELWFADADPISIHALAYASHEILHRIYRKRGLSDLLFDTVAIKDEYRSEFAQTLKQSANFFKHANKEDENETRTFKLAANDLFLLMSIIAIDRMKEQRSDVESAFMFWHFLVKPKWFSNEPHKNDIPVERLNRLRKLDKQQFLDSFMNALAEKRRRGIDIHGDPIK